mmetsp:Transcript_12352/g.37089  ORF Transcript_12352/g.37089 Transcript_12352/m.37089 type:complete len:577 (+) Transcript_12352:202-1932(+)
MGAQTSHLGNQLPLAKILDGMLGREAFSLEQTLGDGSKDVKRFAFGGEMRNGKAVWAARGGAATGAVDETETVFGKRQPGNRGEEIVEVSFVLKGKQASWVYHVNGVCRGAAIQFGEDDVHEATQTIIPAAGQRLGDGGYVVRHHPTFMQAFKYLQYPFFTRLVRLRRQGTSWGINCALTTNYEGVKGYRTSFSETPFNGKTPIRRGDVVVEMDGVYYPEQSRQGSMRHQLVRSARHSERTRMTLLVASPAHIRNEGEEKYNAAKAIAALDERYAEKVAAKKVAPGAAGLQLGGAKTRKVCLSLDEMHINEPGMHLWYRLPADLLSNDGGGGVTVHSAQLSCGLSAAGLASIHVRDGKGGWHEIGMYSPCIDQRVNTEIPKVMLSSTMEIGIRLARSVAMTAAGLSDDEGEGEECSEDVLRITSASLLTIVEPQQDKEEDQEISVVASSYGRYPFMTRDVTCDPGEVTLRRSPPVKGYEFGFYDATNIRSGDLRYVVEINGIWMLDVENQATLVEREILRKSKSKTLHVVVATKEDIESMNGPPPPEYDAPPSHAEVMEWPQYRGLPQFADLFPVS